MKLNLHKKSHKLITIQNHRIETEFLEKKYQLINLMKEQKLHFYFFTSQILGFKKGVKY